MLPARRRVRDLELLSLSVTQHKTAGIGVIDCQPKLVRWHSSLAHDGATTVNLKPTARQTSPCCHPMDFISTAPRAFSGLFTREIFLLRSGNL